MENKKYKRDFLPDLRKLTKELEDMIVEKNEQEQEMIVMKIEDMLMRIKKAKVFKD